MDKTERTAYVHVLLDLGLPALTVCLGMQTLRIFLPTVLNYYGVQPGVSFTAVGILGLGVFALGLIAPLVHRLLGPRLALIVTVGGVGLLRLLSQLTTDPPLLLVMSAVAVVLFLWFIPVYLGQARARGEGQTTHFGVAILLGLVLDTALQGSAMTWDLIWQQGILTLLVIAVLAAAQLALLARYVLVGVPDASDAPFASSLVLLMIGPFLALEEIVFQNVAHLTALSGQSLPTALGWIVAGNVLALALAIRAARARRLWWLSLVGAILLFLCVATLHRSAWAPLWFMCGQVVLAVAVVSSLAAVDGLPTRRGFWRIPLASASSTLLFALLVFVYYIRYDIRLPFDNLLVLLVAALVVGLCWLAATLRPGAEGEPVSVTWAPAVVALCLLVLPFGLGLVSRPASPSAGKGWPVRVMTYNLHFGFDTDGRLALEDLAQTIEQAKPDIVGLQEVSRGWYVAGAADMLTWLSQRLNMPYVFAPASDAIWGNAILSRYPIKDWGYAPLRWFGEPLKRSYLWAQIDLGNGQDVLLIDTHLHHLADGGEIRQKQVADILSFWNKRSPAIIIGDMNAEPGDPEIALCRAAGLVDAIAAAGAGNALTYISSAPCQRIDYIWTSRDLTASDVLIPQTTASDHLGVAVTVGR